jgi:hypothetical protein
MIKYFFVFILCISCKQDNNIQLTIDKEIIKNKDFFVILEKKWEFYQLNFNPIVKNDFENWTKWKNFTNELYYKPKYSLIAFQQKSKDLTKKADSLSLTLPNFINKTEVITRFKVLNLHLKNLEMYLNLKKIKQKQVLLHLKKINEELLIIEKTINEIALKSSIVKEAGEENIFRLKDTTRAANNFKQPK